MLTEFSLDMLLKIIKLTRSSYFTEHKGNYVYRRMTLVLRNPGFVVTHKKVQCLMKVLGLTARIRRKCKHFHIKRLVRKQITLFNASLKHPSQWKSSTQILKNLPSQKVAKNSIYR